MEITLDPSLNIACLEFCQSSKHFQLAMLISKKNQALVFPCFSRTKNPKTNNHPLSKLENSPRLAQIQSAKLHKARMANQPHPKNPVGNNSSRCPSTPGRSEKRSVALFKFSIFLLLVSKLTYTYIDHK